MTTTLRSPIRSLHHVTATVDAAQDDLDFCVGALGLRLLKKTVNFDNHHVYHFYYGDERGAPGTIWTTFPYKGHGVPIGKKGAGQITITSFSVPESSLDFWKARLRGLGMTVTDGAARFGEESVVCVDPSGLTPPVPGHEVGGDAVEPRAGVVVAGVEAGPPIEGDPEGLGGEVLPRRAGAADAPAMDRGPVAVEDHGERGGVGERRRDQRGIRAELLVEHWH